MRLASWWFWSIVPRPERPGGEALCQLGRHTHGSLDCAHWLLRDSVETSM